MLLRIGNGYDAHKFGGEGPLVLGGVEVPHTQGLVAHSDGDVVLHALSDALLGALALGDIGGHFPDTDPALKAVDSRKILRQVMTLVAQNGFMVNNLDITVIAQAPRLAPYIMAMRELIAKDCLVNTEQVSVKATTTEKMGFEGRKEGIGVHASVLLRGICE